MPTLADITNSSKELNTDGISYLPTLLSIEEQKEHKYLYWEFHELGGRKALRSGDWKLIKQPINGETTTQLYNIKEDIHEDNNLVNEYPEKVKELEELMEGARTHSEMFNFGMQIQ